MRPLASGFLISVLLHLLLVAVVAWLFSSPAQVDASPRPLPLTLAMFADAAPASPVTAPRQPAPQPPAPPAKPQPAPRAEPVVEQPPVAAAEPSTPELSMVASEQTVAAQPSLDATQLAQMEEAYRLALRNLIEAGKVYPLKARRLHHQGEVLLSFTIAADGTIRDVQLGSSSGSAILDEAALALVRGLSGRLPAPVGLAQRERSFTIPLAYRIK